MTPERAPTWLALPGAVAFVSTAALLLWYWRDGLPYDATSGVWLALADDFARGILYRPLHDASGFGGTRYMPLFFMLHGWLIRAGMPIVTSGILLTFTSLILLLTAVFGVLRRLGVNPGGAASATALLLCSISVQLLGIAVKGDLLAAALNVWGMYFALGYAQRGHAASLAAALVIWTLAFSTKITAVGGAAAFIIWSTTPQRRATATRVAIALAITLPIVFLGWNIASDGRMLTSFRAVGDGGVSTGYLLAAPWWLLRAAIQDPFLLVIAATAAVLSWRRRDFGALWFTVTLAATLVIFATPGTDTNHFVDLLAVSAVVIGLTASEIPALAPQTRSARLYRGSCVALAVMIALTWLPGAPSVRHFFHARGRPTWSDIAEMRSVLGERAALPVLAENPAVPLLLGQRPEVLDPFNLRLLAARDTSIARDFASRLERRYYNTVILMDWSGADPASIRTSIDAHSAAGVEHFYGGMNFPAHFLDLLWREYRVQSVSHPFVLFEPL